MSNSGLPLKGPGLTAAEETSAAKMVRPLHVLLGFIIALIFATIGILGWILLPVFLIICFREDRGMFVGGVIFVCLALLLIASCFVLLSQIH